MGNLLIHHKLVCHLFPFDTMLLAIIFDNKKQNKIYIYLVKIDYSDKF